MKNKLPWGTHIRTPEQQWDPNDPTHAAARERLRQMREREAQERERAKKAVK